MSGLVRLWLTELQENEASLDADGRAWHQADPARGDRCVYKGVCSLLVRNGQGPSFHQARGHLHLIVLAQGRIDLCWCVNYGA